MRRLSLQAIYLFRVQKHPCNVVRQILSLNFKVVEGLLVYSSSLRYVLRQHIISNNQTFVNLVHIVVVACLRAHLIQGNQPDVSFDSSQ